MSIPIRGHIDADHRLSAEVPDSIPPGPVTIWVEPLPQHEDDAGAEWQRGIAREWQAELADTREDIYSLTDGSPVDASE